MKLKITVNKFVSGLLNENCYVVVCDDACIVVDPGNAYEQVMKFTKSNNIKVLAVILTHGHFDHIADCHKFKNDGIKIYIHKLDADKCEDNLKNLSAKFYKLQTFIPDVLLDGKEFVFNVGNFEIKMLHTPGHSKGGCSYIIGNYLFTGDTLFENTYGRTDFYDGNITEMMESLKLLQYYVNEGYILCSGHSS